MTDKELLTQLEERLKARLGLRITTPMLRDLGILIEMPKPARICECGQRHYAKGKCYRHYMKSIRQRTAVVNDFGQRIGRNDIVLCDHEPSCDWEYSMKVKTQWPENKKWYCSHHWQELFEQAKITDIKVANFLNETGMTENGKSDGKCTKDETSGIDGND